MHTTLWGLSQVLLSGREAGGKGQGSVAFSGSQDCGWCPAHTGTMSPGARGGPKGTGVLEEAVFVCQAGGLDGGPLHRVLSG